MINFTSALYLGLYHPSLALKPWSHLTTGSPAALYSPPSARAVAKRLAALQGCQRAVLLPSTLHLFWDLFGILARRRCIFYIDRCAYPIARWGLERVQALGGYFRSFSHHDIGILERRMDEDADRRMRPVVVTDGFYPGCGRNAPLRKYMGMLQSRNGLLVVDDTQALGILGDKTHGDGPYGSGGGGSLAWHDIRGPGVLMASSLGKGFGVPLAVLSGSKWLIHTFERESQTRVHCSPPSMAAVHAADAALDKNSKFGDRLRRRLARRVFQFQRHLHHIGLHTRGSLSPVQSLLSPMRCDVPAVHRQLLMAGVQTVLSKDPHGISPRIVFLLRADLRKDEISTAVGHLANIMRQVSDKLKPRKIHYGNRRFKKVLRPDSFRL